MSVSKKKQRVVVTAVPAGWTTNNLLRVRVHLSPRLSYSGSGATLADFPDWLSWPDQKKTWRVEFAGQVISPTRVVSLPDRQLWAGAFRKQLPVNSYTGDPGPIRKVYGYSYDTLHQGLLQAMTADTIGQSAMGQAAPEVLAAPRTYGRGPSQSLGASMLHQRSFFVPDKRHKQSPVIKPPKPDFHDRLSLLGDHTRLLEAFGLVLTLEVAPPTTGGRLRVLMSWHPDSSVQTEIVSPFTANVLRASGAKTFVAARRDGNDSGMDEKLRLRLDDPEQYGVYSLDVDGTTTQVVGLATSDPDQPPPTGRSGGLTVVQHARMARLTSTINAGRDAALRLLNGRAVTLYAEDLIAGHHIELTQGGNPTWFGIGHREVEYSVGSGSTAHSFTGKDEAIVTVAARQVDPKSPAELLVSDVLVRWDGWSIAVEPPARALMQTDSQHSTLGAPQGQPDMSWLRIRERVPTINAEGQEGRLPSLRFGRSYKIRARAQDVTGGFQDWTDAPIAPITTYFRWEPAAPPLAVPPATLTAGENATTLVVRSNPRSGSAATVVAPRMLVPPRIAVDMGLTHGLFDDEQLRPDAGAFDRIAGLDDQRPPQSCPAPGLTGEPAPSPVRWLPDPMTSATRIDVRGVGGRDVSFLPTGQESTDGAAAIGTWQAVNLVLKGGAPGSSPGFGPIENLSGQRIARVTLPPADVRRVMVRAQPHATWVGQHGVAALQPGTPQQQAAAVAAGDVPALTPTRELTLIHAVRQPLTDPGLLSLGWSRFLGIKDPTVSANVSYEPHSTGRVTVLASWQETLDAGAVPTTSPDWSPPSRLTVDRSVLFDQEIDNEKDLQTNVELVGTVAFPDLRRRDLTVWTVATSRFVPEFRETLTPSWQAGGGRTQLVLPDDVDVESVLLSRTGKALTRGVDYLVEPASTGDRRTVWLAAGVSTSGITVQGVHGTVLGPGSDQAPVSTTLVIASAVRPAPPKPVYAVPAFEITPGAWSSSGTSVAQRRGGLLRIWLERPWWSSGDGEQLAVLTSVSGATLGNDDQSAAERLVTLFGADPATRTSSAPTRTGQPVSGTTVTGLAYPDEPTVAGATFSARMHDVHYSSDRDLYAAEVDFGSQPAGTFVRLALARYQPEMVGPNPVRISPIVTLDPVRLLPDRRATARQITGGRVQVSILGLTHRGPDDARIPLVRVSIQRKETGGAGVGWVTLSSVSAPMTTSLLDLPTFDSPPTGNDMRLLVEEFERWQAVDAQGAPVSPASVVDQPATMADALLDYSGQVPVWVATLPIPRNTPSTPSPSPTRTVTFSSPSRAASPESSQSPEPSEAAPTAAATSGPTP